MNRALLQRFETEVLRQLAKLLEVPQERVKVERAPASGKESVDMIVRAGNYTVVFEFKPTGQAAAATVAARQARLFADKLRKPAIPVVAVPYMGEVGRRICEEAKVSWLDLSGNAHLIGPPGLHIHIEGRPNLFKRPGRPRSLFAPKSSRIARVLLIEPDREFSQRELARKTGLDEGFTSRILRGLEAQQLVRRGERGRIKVADFDAMLDAWREIYDFSRHHIVRGHVAARSSDGVMRQLAEHLTGGKIEYAATGLAGAWLLDHFAGFRLVVFYVSQLLSEEMLRAAGFREETSGENVWLVVPNDEGVFEGVTERDGVRCAHAVQVYLDLKDHPERSTEAAEHLRTDLLRGRSHA